MKYDDVKPGEWIRPIRKGYKMRCCDCGLVHRLDFKVRRTPAGRSVIMFRAYRDERATAAIRAHARRKR